jgi:hypothetical protein
MRALVRNKSLTAKGNIGRITRREEQIAIFRQHILDSAIQENIYLLLVFAKRFVKIALVTQGLSNLVII